MQVVGLYRVPQQARPESHAIERVGPSLRRRIFQRKICRLKFTYCSAISGSRISDWQGLSDALAGGITRPFEVLARARRLRIPALPGWQIRGRPSRSNRQLRCIMTAIYTCDRLAYLGINSGSVMVNREPCPKVLSTVIVPFICSMACFTMDSPKPVPPT